MGTRTYHGSGAIDDCEAAYERLVDLMGIATPPRRLVWRPENHIDHVGGTVNLLVAKDAAATNLTFDGLQERGCCIASSGGSGELCQSYPFALYRMNLPNPRTQAFGMAWRMKKVSAIDNSFISCVRLQDFAVTGVVIDVRFDGAKSLTNWILAAGAIGSESYADTGIAIGTGLSTVMVYVAGGRVHANIDGQYGGSVALPGAWTASAYGTSQCRIFGSGIAKGFNVGWIQIVTDG